MSEPPWPDDWPGSAWPGYFSRTQLHRVQVANSRRLSRILGLADCGAVCVRPRRGADYSYCTRCPRCFPHHGS
jgi:hypothetical protein